MGNSNEQDGAEGSSKSRTGNKIDWVTPADVPKVRKEIKNGVINHAKHMVELLIENAGKGQYQALKYLFEMVGLFPFEEQKDGVRQTFFSQFLLEHLGIDQATLEKRIREAGEQSKASNSTETQTTTPDTVE